MIPSIFEAKLTLLIACGSKMKPTFPEAQRSKESEVMQN
jgi:hypothetical protein